MNIKDSRNEVGLTTGIEMMPNNLIGAFVRTGRTGCLDLSYQAWGRQRLAGNTLSQMLLPRIHETQNSIPSQDQFSSSVAAPN